MSIRPVVLIAPRQALSWDKLQDWLPKAGFSIVRPGTGTAIFVDELGDEVEVESLPEQRTRSEQGASFSVFGGTEPVEVALASLTSGSESWRFEISLWSISESLRQRCCFEFLRTFLEFSSQGKRAGILLDPEDYSEHEDWLHLIGGLPDVGLSTSSNWEKLKSFSPSLMGVSISSPPSLLLERYLQEPEALAGNPNSAFLDSYKDEACLVLSRGVGSPLLRSQLGPPLSR